MRVSTIHVHALLSEETLVNGSLRVRVVQHLHSLLPHTPSMRDTAGALGLSERSLRRRLVEEGCTFTGLVESLRLELAQELLKDQARSIKQIAAELGFSELSAFHRAFKRWTGDTPVTFRVRLRDSP